MAKQKKTTQKKINKNSFKIKLSADKPWETSKANIQEFLKVLQEKRNIDIEKIKERQLI